MRSTWLYLAAMPPSACLLIVILSSFSIAQESAKETLPGRYFRLMETELALIEKRLETESSNDAEFNARHYPSALLAAAVLYAKQHPSNTAFGDKRKLALALKLGDLLAAENEKGRYTQLLNHPWGTYLWLEAYRLLEKDLEGRPRWRKELQKNIQALVEDTAVRVDYPRYQSPFIRTSPNHFAQWASTIYLAGRMFQRKDWENLGARVMHRFATEEQTQDGYWGEHNDSGPTPSYNYLTFTGLALYWEHSRDPAALKALRRATSFHEYFTYPDGTSVEVINDRNRHSSVSYWGHFGFSHFTDGRRYAEFLTGFFREGKLGGESTGVAQTLGRLAQNALYYHEGPTAPIPQDRLRYDHQMTVPAGIRKTGPWVVCLSGLISTQAVTNQFYLDRQGHLSVFHEKVGLIITGANSKRQPELATFTEKIKDQVYHMPISSGLRMGDERDRLGLAYNSFFTELEVRHPDSNKVAIHFDIVERGRLEEAQLTLQLRLKTGELLETSKSKVILSENRIELGPKEIDGRIHHRGWSLRVPADARLVWPVYPFNPYANDPETKLDYAVGTLTVPLHLKASSGSGARGQKLDFSILVKDGGSSP
jgi:hypothetical protein